MKAIEMALSVRQPWAEQILRGVKRAEFRSRRTRMIGVPFYLYASKMPGPKEEFTRIGCEVGGLPTGVLVGVARVASCEKLAEGSESLTLPGAVAGMWAWHLEGVRRLWVPVAAERKPQPAWWRPFERPRKPRFDS